MVLEQLVGPTKVTIVYPLRMAAQVEGHPGLGRFQKRMDRCF